MTIQLESCTVLQEPWNLVSAVMHLNSRLEAYRRIWWKTTAGDYKCVHRCCGPGRETWSAKMRRLCPEGKLLFYHCIQRRHERTRIETKASLDDLGGKLSWFLHPDRNVTEARRWDVMVFFLSVCFSSMFCWPGLVAFKRKRRCYLRGGRGSSTFPSWRKCPGGAGVSASGIFADHDREQTVFILFMFIWNYCIAGYLKQNVW